MPSPSPAPVDFLSHPRYSQSSYGGRVLNFFSVIDPRTLLASDEQVKKAVRTIQEYKNGKREGVTQEQIWEAKKLKVRKMAHAQTHSAADRTDRRGRLTVARTQHTNEEEMQIADTQSRLRDYHLSDPPL